MIPTKRERHLCADCAELESVIVKQPPQTANDVLQKFIAKNTGDPEAGECVCPQCGISFRTFQTNGQLGCPHDYDVFRGILAPLIERAHEGSTHHIGKVPTTADDTARKQAGLLRLRRQLDEALEKENYEVAARVRDEIQSMESA